MKECVNCKCEHKEKFLSVDLVGDYWCIDCLAEELDINVQEVKVC